MDASTGTTSSIGQWVAVAGLIVIVLNHFGINVVQSDIETVIGAIVILYGIIHSLVAHQNLKTLAGVK